MFSDTMTSCLGSRLALPHIRFDNAKCGRRFLLNTEKKTTVFENTRLRGDVQIRFKNATCGRRLFLSKEEKISVFKNTQLRVDEASKNSRSQTNQSLSVLWVFLTFLPLPPSLHAIIIIIIIIIIKTTIIIIIIIITTITTIIIII